MLKASFVIGLIAGILGILTGTLGVFLSFLGGATSNESIDMMSASAGHAFWLIVLSIIGIVGASVIQKNKFRGAILQSLYPVIGFIMVGGYADSHRTSQVLVLFSFPLPALLFSVSILLGVIALPTSQQVSPPPIPTAPPTGKYFGYELATHGQRLFAFIIHTIIIMIPTIIWDNYLATLVLSAILAAIFYPTWSGNVGHKFMGLKVVSSVDGSDIDKASAGAIREVLKSIFSSVIIPVAWLLWDGDRQNLYDKVSKTSAMVP